MMSSNNRNTRERILKAAWSMLEAGEGASTRMADIAKRAGISRQGLYLHFANRAELLIALTRYMDEVNEVDKHLVASRAATSGVDRLEKFIEAWGGYIPLIYPVAKALMAMMQDDDEARSAWNDRMRAVRHGCAAAVDALKRDGVLVTEMSAEESTDLLWALLSVRSWEQLRFECGWTQERYMELIKQAAHAQLVDTP